MSPSAAMLYYRQKTKHTRGASTTPQKKKDMAAYARAYVGSSFFWIDSIRNPRSAGTSLAYAGYRKHHEKTLSSLYIGQIITKEIQVGRTGLIALGFFAGCNMLLLMENTGLFGILLKKLMI